MYTKELSDVQLSVTFLTIGERRCTSNADKTNPRRVCTPRIFCYAPTLLHDGFEERGDIRNVDLCVIVSVSCLMVETVRLRVIVSQNDV